MAENTTKLYDAISGLHETDSKIWGKTQEVSGAVGIQSFPTTVTSVVATDGKISDDLLPGVTFNNKGTDENFIMGSNIKFIGNCNVTRDSSGQLIIRIGDNLNSSTFNMKDGVTDGSGKYTRSTTPYSTRVVNGVGSTNNVWIHDGSDTVTIETNGKIHFDDKINTKFQLDVKARNADGTETLNTFTFGGITANGYYTNNSTVTTTAPAGGKSGEGAYMYVSNLVDESKKSEGATGYEGNVKFVINLNKLAVTKGNVYFRVEMISGTTGGKAYPEDKLVNNVATEQYTNVGYFIPDNTTKPAVSNLTAKLKEEPKTKTWAGITSIISGIVVYSVDVANLNTPATDQTAGASIQFNNSSNYAGDVAKYSQTTYDGTITKEAYLTTSTGKYTTFNVSVSGWNIIDKATASTSGLLDDDNVAISGLDVYAGTPDSSILSGYRVTLDSKTIANKVAYTDTAAPGANDLMVYHGELQYPSAFITSAYFGNSSYVAPNTSGDKEALFYFSSSGTEKGGQLVINGTGLTTNVKSVTLGNSSTNLLDITSTTGIGTAPDKTATKLTFPYTFKDASQYIDSSTGCWVKIVLSGTGAKITSITRS